MNKLLHLYRRAGFGLSPSEWQDRRNWSLDQAIDDLFLRAQSRAPLPEGDHPEYTRGGMMAAARRKELQKMERQAMMSINHNWLSRMAAPGESSLLERMCFFWHGHFACEVKAGLLAIRQLNTLRAHGLGNFRDLVLAVARDPAMIRYLNNQQNRKFSPNENFARELMELFTIGRGHYTEMDVKEAARAFTGWSGNLAGEYVFRARQHDNGTKTFMGKTGNFNGEDIIDIILEQEETARFICRKVYRHFVNDTVDESHVNTLAAEFRSLDYDIAALMRSVFSSDWFYASENTGNKIKSPVELLAGTMRQLEVSNIATQGLIGLQFALGQVLFRPPNVAGWPGGRTWIDNSTLLLRLNLAAALFQAADFNFELAPELEQENKRQLKRLNAEINTTPLAALAQDAGQVDGKQGVASLVTLLLATPPPDFKTGPKPSAALVALRLMSLPEYQLC
ncbi:DUF1800 domain-containing protein [Neolewinella aurantiaca]|uniref:DUF1800 domain-containing protein n=1 Tax=Neolewinella aurantiaca TaxID=2602767 RepID=A0A5C7FJ13_9BACT|nr:DUF1800 domain-containing protein [Neolewinella aurantiaca]TXF89803.1 DUF1800 domain-containing protein [Neolewinella aurantiaca]